MFFVKKFDVGCRMFGCLDVWMFECLVVRLFGCYLAASLFVSRYFVVIWLHCYLVVV